MGSMTPLTATLPFNRDCIGQTFEPAKRGGALPDRRGHWLIVQDQGLVVSNDNHELALPFGDATFDVVFEANVLHHVGDRRAVVREMTRVSRRYVVLLEPNRYNPLMFGFSLVVPAERGGLKSSLQRLHHELREAGARVMASIVTGMISQNNTPRALVPLLQRFDRPIAWGEYLVAVAEVSRVEKV